MAAKCKIIKGREICSKPNLFMKSYLNIGPYPLFSDAADDVFDLMPTEPLPQLKSLMATFVDSQVASGHWPDPTVPGSGLMDCFQFYYMDTNGNKVINWIGNFSNALLVNSPTSLPFSAIQGDGATSFVDSQFTPSVDGVNMSVNDIGVSVFLDTQSDAGTTKYIFGGTGATATTSILQQTTPRLIYVISAVSSNILNGLLLVSDTLYSTIRRDGAAQILAIDTAETSNPKASIALTEADIWVLAVNNAGNHMNASVGCFASYAAVGFDLDNFNTNLRILITGAKALA